MFGFGFRAPKVRGASGAHQKEFIPVLRDVQQKVFDEVQFIIAVPKLRDWLRKWPTEEMLRINPEASGRHCFSLRILS